MRTLRVVFAALLCAGAAAASALVVWLAREIGPGTEASLLIGVLVAGAVVGAADAWLGGQT